MPAHSERVRFLSARIKSLNGLKNAFGLTPGQADELGRLTVEMNTGAVPRPNIAPLLFVAQEIKRRDRPMLDRATAPNGDRFPMAEGFVHQRIGRAIGGFVEGGFTGAAREFVRGGNPRLPKPPARCGSGFSLDSRGNCVQDRFPIRVGPIGIDPGAFLPGGDPGIGFVPRETTTAVGEAVIGAFDMPAIVPEVVGTIRRRDGSTGPILHCPPGSVLGRDDLCYMGLTNKWRKWPKASRPPVSASDAKCIRRAASATKRVERLAKSVGLKTRKR